MRQELTVEIAASREVIWHALAGELVQRGDHVFIEEERRPERLQLDVRTGPGERLHLGYLLVALNPDNTAVHASVEPAGPRYALKRLLTFGAVDRAYLDAIAVGLQNLQQHLEAPDRA